MDLKYSNPGKNQNTKVLFVIFSLLYEHSNVGKLDFAGMDHFHNDVNLLKYFQEHHLPRYHVDLNLKSVHCSQQRMK